MPSSEARSERVGVHFRFNAWGGKFAPFDRDERSGGVLAARYGDDVVAAPIVLEGGSIAVDGVSLTVNRVEGARFDLNIVPHTLQGTTIDQYQPGRPVNLEVDVIARHLERLLLGDAAAESAGGVTLELLARHGFVK